MSLLFRCSLVAVSLFFFSLPSSAMISVGEITPEKAKEMGVFMKQRKNGNAGTKVWIEFEKEGVLAKYVYVEMTMVDADGKHVLSARLQQHPVIHGQDEKLVSFSFSVTPDQLKNCSFMIVSQDGIRTAMGHVMKVREFLELKESEHEQSKDDEKTK